MELTAQNITKKIRNKLILDGISLKLIGGRIYVIKGANGSGKTMLLRALSGLMSIDSGIITLDGKVLRRDYSVLPSLRIMLENVSLYPNMTGFQNLEYLAKLKGKVGAEEIRDAIGRVGLESDDKRTYRKYSLGMKQRLAIAQAVMESPDVILLDEPTNALDRDGVSLIHKLILEEKERGALIVIATHSTEDMRLLADDIFLMEPVAPFAHPQIGNARMMR
jgi:ABC-2 type transport system ATP-binding protein